MEERLQKILAKAGLASRRQAETLISAGRVAVDGIIVGNLGAKADIERNVITLDGHRVAISGRHHYWMINKPAGLVSTRFDPQKRPTVLKLLPENLRNLLYPVGRLDLDSEGLLLLTNDGELAYRLMHPKFKVTKTYQAWVAGQPQEKQLDRLRQGIMLEGKKTAPAKVEILAASTFRSHLQLVLTEGRKREVRLMCQAIGHPVLSLTRLKIGFLELAGLDKGKARELTVQEVAKLRAYVRLDKKTALPPCKAEANKVRKSARDKKFNPVR